jgi:putative two-component system response regulator
MTTPIQDLPNILIVDDEPIARTTIEALLFGQPYTLHFAEDGQLGIDKAKEIVPDVILLDVMMPGMTGYEVCKALRELEQLKEIPILMVTALDDRSSKLTGIRAGADDFITKPYDGMELIARLQGVLRLNRFRRIVEQRSQIEKMHKELLVAYDQTLQGWSNALDLRDRETEGHTERVCALTMQLAREMGIGGEDLQHIWRGCMLHDVGKLGIPDAILHKPGPLTDDEWVIMRRHPEYAYEWLSRIEYLLPALDIPYCHHEKWDGSGYPRHLKGEEIPLAARLFAIVDVWDALTSDRPYRKAMTPEEALAVILPSSGSHFDPRIVDLFRNHLHRQNLK